MKLLQYLSVQSDPEGCDAELMKDRTNWAVFHSRPDMADGGQIIWRDLMTALGHTSTLSTKSRAPNHAQTQAFCWLGAARIENIVISASNFLSPKQLSDLCAMTTSLGVSTWLLYDVDSCDERNDALLRLNPQRTDIVAFLETRVLYPEKNCEEGRMTVPRVQDTHFLEFLETANESLSSDPKSEEKLAKISDLFSLGRKKMFTSLADNPSLDEGLVAMLLHEITSQTSDVNEVICLVKGAQAAAFLSGWNLKVDIQRWIQRGKISSLSMNLEEHDWRAISRLQPPCVVATCVLSVIGISSDDMPFIRVDAIADGGFTIEHNGKLIAVPERARELLQVQLIYRNLVGSQQSPFLVQGPKESIVSDNWTGEIMRNATKETGVALRGRVASRKSTSEANWMRRSGVSVARLSL